MTYSREELFELAASYALGATTPEESRAVEEAMKTWPELAAEVASFREVTAELARMDGVRPSADVRKRLMRETGDGRRETRYSWILYAASIVGIAILTGALLVQRQRTQEIAAKLEHRETTLNTLLHAEKDLIVVHMKAADTVKGPGIQFFWNEKHRTGVAHAFRLTPVPAGRTYQLWVIQDGKPVSVKLFNSDPDGHALVENLDLPPSSAGATALYLTVEPAGGSPAPTTTPIMGGAIPTTH